MECKAVVGYGCCSSFESGISHMACSGKRWKIDGEGEDERMVEYSSRKLREMAGKRRADGKEYNLSEIFS